MIRAPLLQPLTTRGTPSGGHTIDDNLGATVILPRTSRLVDAGHI